MIGESAPLPVRAVTLVLLSGGLVSGCSVPWADTSAVSVMEVKEPGRCFRSPDQDLALRVDEMDYPQVAAIRQTDCDEPHELETLGAVGYPLPGTDADYPGENALKVYAMGVCCTEFTTYLNIDYRRSVYEYTYLVPSPRSWTDGDDRDVICFATTSQKTLSRSVKAIRT